MGYTVIFNPLILKVDQDKEVILEQSGEWE